ncbi:MAG: hypothetical protein HC796_02195 [Synechococcaceae cyanobacterium RL_1_2]|nr:hypothetical protein [Synechococcaceae cyanobacterium RL_1_2]
MNNTQAPFFLLNCTLGLCSMPVLGAIITIEQTQQWLGDGTRWPEEIFRGDRLPLLPFPHNETPHHDG